MLRSPFCDVILVTCRLENFSVEHQNKSTWTLFTVLFSNRNYAGNNKAHSSTGRKYYELISRDEIRNLICGSRDTYFVLVRVSETKRCAPCALNPSPKCRLVDCSTHGTQVHLLTLVFCAAPILKVGRQPTFCLHFSRT